LNSEEIFQGSLMSWHSLQTTALFKSHIK